MNDILVHAGNLKTGTTAIQAVLKALRPALASHGIVMPALEAGQPAHYQFSIELRDAGHKRPDIAAANRPACAKLNAALGQIKETEVPLLTAETIMSSKPWALHDLLGQIPGRQPRFLFYMRPHAGLLSSLYLQLVKTGKYSESVTEVLPRLTNLAAMRFINVVDEFALEFGDEAITVREFSRDRLVAGSIIADFWDAFDLPLDLLAQAQAIETISNPTPTVEVSVLLRAWRLHLVQELKTTDQLGMLRLPTLALFKALTDAKLSGGKFQLPVAIQEQLAERWEGPRKKFAMRWFQLPPTDAWLKEPIIAPSAPQPLPFDAVETAATDALKRMRRQNMQQQADQMPSFLASLPIETEAGERMIDIAALETRMDSQALIRRVARVRPAVDTAAAPLLSPNTSSPEPSIQEM